MNAEENPILGGNPELAGETTTFDAGDPEIPDKLYFRIGEVAKLAGIKPYVLRFWETEFTGLGPRKSGTGHRLYRRKEVELVFEIKRLLYEQRFTIEGARKHLEARNKPGLLKPLAKPAANARKKKEQTDLFSMDSPAQIEIVKAELRAIADLLK
jgi:DNA-binding transcriptional MerR regulator